ncbi:MAG: hypothetical protein ABL958_01275 [Bdellovibrionia bacterium]
MFKVLLALVLALPTATFADDPATYGDDDLTSILSYETGEGDEQYADGNGDTTYEEFQRRQPNRRDPPRRQPPRRPPNRRDPPRRATPWYFLGCTNSQFNCSWAATRYGFSESRVEWDIRCRRAMYACYGRNRWE